MLVRNPFGPSLRLRISFADIVRRLSESGIYALTLPVRDNLENPGPVVCRIEEMNTYSAKLESGP